MVLDDALLNAYKKSKIFFLSGASYIGTMLDVLMEALLKGEIKTHALMTDETTSSIVHSALRVYPLSSTGGLPRNEALMLMIRRQRNVETVDVNGRLLDKLKKTHRDEGFHLAQRKRFNYLYNED